jgi:hypothetical protein
MLRVRVAGALVVLFACLTAVPALAAPSPSSTQKYYIVGTDSEFLFDIARRTLGDGRRYPEIIRLNENRVQPDGKKLAATSAVRTGWILILPADASGPGVHNGTPPSEAPPAKQSISMAWVVIPAVGVILAAALIWRRRKAVPAKAKARPRPTGESHPPLTSHMFRSVARHGEDLVSVQLVGVSTTGPYAHRWIGAGEPRPNWPAAFVAGADQGMDLYIDISRCPDVVTVTGQTAPRSRLARSMAAQLARYGTAVTVVGEVAGELASDRIRTVRGYSDIDWGDPPAVIIGPPNPGRRPTGSAKSVIVLVGPQLRARWSIHVQAAEGR